MSSIRSARPSPALVVSIIALVVALGGTSYAAFSLPEHSVGTKQLKNGAVTRKKLRNGAVTNKKLRNGAVSASKLNTSGLTVPNALHANSAHSATNATHATSATNASHATSATNATHAASATNATHATSATNAQTAAVADAIGRVIYVKGNVVDAPANGGSGFGESPASIATCPAGTVVIGTGAHAGAPSVDVSGVDIFSTTATAPNHARAVLDNFNNLDAPGNYVIAVCAAAHTVRDPSGLSSDISAKR